MQIWNLFLALYLISCQQKHTEQKIDEKLNVTDSVAVIGDSKINMNVQQDVFTQIDTSGILMSPLALAEANDDGGSYSSGSRESNYWNIIFYNSKTGGYHLLSDSMKMVIWNYSIQNDNDYSSSSEVIISSPGITSADGFIFYRITVKDYNNDKKLTNTDPAYLFVSDKEGNNLQQISPANCDLLSYQIIKASGKVLMNIIKDSNNDKKFEENDEHVWYELKVKTDSIPDEILKQDFKNKIKLLFHKQWMKGQ